MNLEQKVPTTVGSVQPNVESSSQFDGTVQAREGVELAEKPRKKPPGSKNAATPASLSSKPVKPQKPRKVKVIKEQRPSSEPSCLMTETCRGFDGRWV